MRKPLPAPHLVNGLRHLVRDLYSAPPAESAGLEDFVCGKTDLVSFDATRVEYCSIDVAALCREASYEAVMWLLLNHELPDEDRLADCCSILTESAVIDQPLADMIGAIPLQTRPLDLFPVCISLLACFDPTPCDRTPEASQSQFWRVMSQLPVLLHVALGGHLNEGRALSDGSRSPSFAGQVLQILRPDNLRVLPTEEQAMDAVMICECLTEMRPACFLARQFGSAVNDTVAGLRAASSMFISQLRNDPFEWASSLMLKFSCPNDAEDWLNGRRSEGMPFGFQKNAPDPRAMILRNQCRELLGSFRNLQIEASSARLESLLARRGWFPTVDWVAARALTMLGIPPDRISLAIGIARMAGWAGHTIEQHASGNSLLPALRYPQVRKKCEDGPSSNDGPSIVR